MSGQIMVDAEAWVRTFEVAIDKVVAASMVLAEQEPRDDQGKIVDTYQRGYIDGVSEITAGLGGVLSAMNDTIARAKGKRS
jgi:hypothetical protein